MKLSQNSILVVLYVPLAAQMWAGATPQGGLGGIVFHSSQRSFL